MPAGSVVGDVAAVRSDRPALTDSEVRRKRAEAIMRVFEQAMEREFPEDSRGSTLEWLERCLHAHETDTLKLLWRDASGLPRPGT